MIISCAGFYKSYDLSIDQKFYVELKKVYVMGFEMQPQIIRAQKSVLKILKLINTTDMFSNVKALFSFI
jgi:hypothetical protein